VLFFSSKRENGFHSLHHNTAIFRLAVKVFGEIFRSQMSEILTFVFDSLSLVQSFSCLFWVFRGDLSSLNGALKSLFFLFILFSFVESNF